MKKITNKITLKLQSKFFISIISKTIAYSKIYCFLEKQKALKNYKVYLNTIDKLIQTIQTFFTN